MLLERQEGVPAADIDVVKGGVDDRAIVEDRADLPRDGLALLERRTRRQLIFDLAVIAVGRRLKLLRDDEKQPDAGKEGEHADADDPHAMVGQARPGDRKSTRLNSITNAHIVRRLLLEKKNHT